MSAGSRMSGRLVAAMIFTSSALEKPSSCSRVAGQVSSSSSRDAQSRHCAHWWQQRQVRALSKPIVLSN